jgi:iron(III) transport system substrate-binding protein
MISIVKSSTWLLLVGLIASGITGCGMAGSSGGSAAEKKPTGNLVVYSAGPKELAERIQKGFEAKTGIRVEMFQGTTGKILARMEAEKSNPVVDVVVLASLPAAQEMQKSGLTMEYKNAKNADKLISEWSDSEGHFFGYSASALGIVYNTKIVGTPPKDWLDLAKAEWNDKIVIPDPELSGSAIDFVTGYLSTTGETGWQLFEQYKKNNATVAGANEEALDLVMTGAKSIVVAGVDYMTYQAKAKGEPIDIIYPASGTVISPRTAAIVKTSKNTDNAKAFIDYLLSDEVQEIIAESYLLPGRKDINAKGRDNAEQIAVLNVDWVWMNANSDTVTKKFIQIFK